MIPLAVSLVFISLVFAAALIVGGAAGWYLVECIIPPITRFFSRRRRRQFPFRGLIPKFVYLCHPFSDDPAGNAADVHEIARGIAAERLIPVAPHLWLPNLLDEAKDRRRAMRICLELVDLCDEVRVYGEPTAGMREEIEYARRCGIPIRETWR